MILSEPLETPGLLLRSLHEHDISPTYLSWLTDPEVNRYLEVRFAGRMGLGDLEAFVASLNASADNLMLGIFLKHDGRHIGNVKLGPIVARHARAEIGFLIGDRTCWGRGYAAEAITAISRYGMDELGLVKITAGCYETNVGSSRALLKAGFRHEATISSHVVSDGQRIASLLYGLQR